MVVKEIVKDKDKKSKSVYVIESEIWGEDAPHIYADYKGNVIEIFEDYGCLEDIINDFQDVTFKEREKELKEEKEKELMCRSCYMNAPNGEAFCDINGFCVNNGN